MNKGQALKQITEETEGMDYQTFNDVLESSRKILEAYKVLYPETKDCQEMWLNIHK